MVHLVRTMLVEDEPEVCEGFRTAFRRYQALSLVYVTDSELQALDYMESGASGAYRPSGSPFGTEVCAANSMCLPLWCCVLPLCC